MRVPDHLMKELFQLLDNIDSALYLSEHNAECGAPAIDIDEVGHLRIELKELKHKIEEQSTDEKTQTA